MKAYFVRSLESSNWWMVDTRRGWEVGRLIGRSGGCLRPSRLFSGCVREEQVYLGLFGVLGLVT